MMTTKFEDWYIAGAPTEPNYHGNYNGLNLAGFDVAKFYLAQRRDPSLTVPDFLRGEEGPVRSACPAREAWRVIRWRTSAGRKGSMSKPENSTFRSDCMSPRNSIPPSTAKLAAAKFASRREHANDTVGHRVGRKPTETVAVHHEIPYLHVSIDQRLLDGARSLGGEPSDPSTSRAAPAVQEYSPNRRFRPSSRSAHPRCPSCRPPNPQLTRAWPAIGCHPVALHDSQTPDSP